jgi:tellurite methyltransferase
LLFYQTFMHTRNDYSRGPKNPEFCLMDNELLHLFADLQLIVYREEGDIGDTTQGFRDEAMLIARKI